MTSNVLSSAVLPVCIALQLAAIPIASFGQDASGGVGGVTRDSTSKQPVANAHITVHNIYTGLDRSATSGSDGAFNMPGLEPGRYQVAAKAEGFAPSTANVQVSAPATAHLDLLLTADAAPTPPKPVPASPSLADEIEALKERIAELEAAMAAHAAPAAGTPAPAPAPQQPAAAPAPAAPAAPSIPESLQSPDSTPGVDNFTPFAYGDFTWLNGTPRNKDTVLDTKYFTPEVRFDTHFMEDFNQPVDHTMGGSTESFRNGEFQEEQISVGGDFHWQNVRGRILTMFGLFATTTPRNDASAGVGQWDLRDAYRYVSEAYGGYHFNVNHGLNVDAGIFVSYIGLFSYYNFDNWTYQPSYVSSNTPWFFDGLRIQWFPTDKLKIEPWIINGWQSYGRFGNRPGLGGQILYRPKPWISMVFNNYGMGEDTLNLNGQRSRIHTDDSVEIKYYDHPEKTLDKMAFSLTGDLGCEYGGGAACFGNKKSGGQITAYKQVFAGWMLYNRTWFKKDKYAITLGGGVLDNPGRYLTLLQPINGADAVSGSPYFPANPGLAYKAWDTSITFDYMPRQYITFLWEFGYRHADQPYFTGRGGITPPTGNNGSPASYVCNDGSATGFGWTVNPSNPTDPNGANLGSAQSFCSATTTTHGGLWTPDLRKDEP